ncbi:MAG: HEAT repeat domain-containing protein [Thermoleophilia bacterium]
MLEEALEDEHHSVRNAVIGALKQMGEKNPEPVLDFAQKHLHHPDPRIRRAVIHGIELRGRTHPEDILPLLKELENDPDGKIRKTVVHVIDQISYKEGCLKIVATALQSWNNQELVNKAHTEILDVHKRYKKFSDKTYDEARVFLSKIGSK